MMRIIAVILSFLLISCSGGPRIENPLTPAMRDGIYIKSVDVDWLQIDGQPASQLSPEDQEKSDKLVSAIKENVRVAFKDSPSGQEPATIKIELHPSHRGSTSDASGEAQVIRNRDGEVLASYAISARPGRSGFMKLVQGKDSKISDVAELFTYELKEEFFR